MDSGNNREKQKKQMDCVQKTEQEEAQAEMG